MDKLHFVGLIGCIVLIWNCIVFIARMRMDKGFLSDPRRPKSIPPFFLFIMWFVAYVFLLASMYVFWKDFEKQRSVYGWCLAFFIVVPIMHYIMSVMLLTLRLIVSTWIITCAIFVLDCVMLVLMVIAEAWTPLALFIVPTIWTLVFAVYMAYYAFVSTPEVVKQPTSTQQPRTQPRKKVTSILPAGNPYQNDYP